MSWKCPKCSLILVNITTKCYCGTLQTTFEPFDSIDEIISLRRIQAIDRLIGVNGEKMTSQEELFSKLFNHEKILVKDMDILTLRAHRESLAQIAFEARARLTAVDDEEKSRKKESNGKPTGFARSLNSDDQTTAAINAVKDRQKRMSGKEKIVEGLIKLGYSRDEAEKKLSAGTVLGRIQAIQKADAAKVEENKPFVNPFAKKEN